jgi:hypothetical protein
MLGSLDVSLRLSFEERRIHPYSSAASRKSSAAWTERPRGSRTMRAGDGRSGGDAVGRKRV